MPRRPRPEILLALALLAAAVPAHASWEVSRNASAEDFSAFHRHFSADAYHYPRHGAAPLGLIGFEVYADATYDGEFDDEEFTDTVIDGDFTGGFLSIARIGARKGLPGGIDIGLAYGRALEGDIKLLSADLQYAILKGGLIKPALSIRLTGTRTLDAEAYELNQYGAEVLLSKGFTVLTPYIGGGIVYSKGTLDRDLLGSLEEEETQGVLYAGVTLNLLLPKITVELERGEVLQGAVRVGFGF
jgi:hypothetical protein